MTNSAHVETLRGRRGCALWLPLLTLLGFLALGGTLFRTQAEQAVAAAQAALTGATAVAPALSAAAAPDVAAMLRDYRYYEGVALRVAPDPVRSADVLNAFAAFAAPPALDGVAAESARLRDLGQYVEQETQTQTLDFSDNGSPVATALASETRRLRTFDAATGALLDERTVSGQVAYELEYTDRWRVTRAVDVAP